VALAQKLAGIFAWWTTLLSVVDHDRQRNTAWLADSSDSELVALRQGGVSDPLDSDEKLSIDIARALISKRDLTAREYSESLEVFETRGIFEPSVVVGFYESLAFVMRVFHIDGRPVVQES
jgi:hypothetical protein